MGFRRPLALHGQIHRDEFMTIPALQRVIGPKSCPFALRQLRSLSQKLFSRVDGAEDLAPNLLGGLHLAGNLVRPVMRDVTVWTGRPNAGAIGIVDGKLDLLEDVVPHLVAADTECLRVGQLKRCIEAAPEDDPRDEAAKRQKAKTEVAAGAVEQFQ